MTDRIRCFRRVIEKKLSNPASPINERISLEYYVSACRERGGEDEARAMEEVIAGLRQRYPDFDARLATQPATKPGRGAHAQKLLDSLAGIDFDELESADECNDVLRVLFDALGFAADVQERHIERCIDRVQDRRREILHGPIDRTAAPF